MLTAYVSFGRGASLFMLSERAFRSVYAGTHSDDKMWAIAQEMDFGDRYEKERNQIFKESDPGYIGVTRGLTKRVVDSWWDLIEIYKFSVDFKEFNKNSPVSKATIKKYLIANGIAESCFDDLI